MHAVEPYVKGRIRKGQKRPAHWKPAGPKKGQKIQGNRTSTKLLRLYAKAARDRPLVAIPIETKAVAACLGVSRRSVQDLTQSFADPEVGGRMVMALQSFKFVVFQRHRPAEGNGHPQWWIMWRYSLHRIGGPPGKLRAGLRKKTASQWNAHRRIIRKIAFGALLNRIKAANHKHSDFPGEKQVGLVKARPPPKGNNRAASRFGGYAVELDGKYHSIPGAPKILLTGWLVNRLGEWHSRARILACLRHAVAVMPRGLYLPICPPAWICAVAERHLAGDGLHPKQRLRDIQEDRPLTRSTSKVDSIPVKPGERQQWTVRGHQNELYTYETVGGSMVPGTYRKL